jgi:diadenosine tetraphosphatase ApaH/serine/threonine PP2A family protein phosphatase
VIGRAASRIGLIADVHSNLQALEAVLRFLDAEAVGEIWCLGDVVGYGGDPSACVALVRQRCAGTVRGNHDAAAVDPELREVFNPHARAAIEGQAALLAVDELAWLAALPAVIEMDEVVLLHGSVVDPDGYGYVFGPADARRELEGLSARWGFYGHTHVPDAWRMDESGTVERLPLPDPPAAVALDRPGRYLVNPGAVGQPRDGDPRASCAIFDRASGRLVRAALDYDIAAAQSAIRRAGMPEVEAVRLGLGR